MDHGAADVRQVLSGLSTNLAQALVSLLGLFERMMLRHAEQTGRDAAVLQRFDEIQQTLRELRERLTRMEQQPIQQVPQPPPHAVEHLE